MADEGKKKYKTFAYYNGHLVIQSNFASPKF